MQKVMSNTYTLGNSKAQIERMIPNLVIKKVKVGDRAIALTRIADEFHAFSSSCPHRGASLIEATINGFGEVICPLHQYRFDLKTGQVKSGSCGELEIFPCELSESGLKIILPDQ
jgi:nitrite reductase/ring-hydroxylating ferredoxin subunit